MRTEYYVEVEGREFCVTIDDIVPPRPAPIAHDHDDPNFSVPPEPGHFTICDISIERAGRWVSIVLTEDLEDTVYELVEDELQAQEWRED